MDELVLTLFIDGKQFALKTADHLKNAKDLAENEAALYARLSPQFANGVINNGPSR